MDLVEFKLKSLGINREKFGTIYSFIDFGNVDYWYEKDERDSDDNILGSDSKLVIDLEKLADFSKLFSIRSRFYYGFDPQKSKSVGFIDKTRCYFDDTIKKTIKNIKHYLGVEEFKANTRQINKDTFGDFIYIPKCNFDVEICVDAIRSMGKYDTFCLFSSDADFIRLIWFLKKNKKKIILIKGGYIQYDLKKSVDLIISAQEIKKDITYIKQKSRL